MVFGPLFTVGAELTEAAEGDAEAAADPPGQGPANGCHIPDMAIVRYHIYKCMYTYIHMYIYTYTNNCQDLGPS